MMALFMLAGCTADQAEDRFRAALPTAEEVTIGVPTVVRARVAASSAAPAQAYVLTRTISEQLNGIVRNVLDTLRDVTSGPPAEMDEHHAVWGPIGSALSPVVYRLVVDDAGHFELDGTPKGADAWQPVLAGDGGGFVLHPPDGGTIQAQHGDGRISMRLDGVGSLVAGEYAYAAAPDGGGTFVFVTTDGAVHAWWGASGAGGATVAGVGTECWDATFAAVACDVP
jgi:hypothetical protein